MQPSAVGHVRRRSDPGINALFDGNAMLQRPELTAIRPADQCDLDCETTAVFTTGNRRVVQTASNPR